MSSTTRGFVGRHTAAERDPRLPPGQYDARHDFPVLSAEVTPELAAADWSFRVDGLVDRPRAWDWEQAHALPRETYDGPIHCVTSWSRLSTDFGGVPLDAFLAEAGPRSTATHAVAYSHTGYTTNLALADLTGGRAWIAFDFEGAPLTPAHGGPARLLVPHLYFWKSVKWIAGLRLLDHDEPGFWEVNGYHHRGDPWAEERYSGD
ncbi:sulfite oxidase-like oxidoreductase [Embleya scabrispora]|uniref:sulfite oxidase-like oxidoreductase n=1 Tax=Embleya scabrispora TaxID=159449 RepID=UPI00035C0C15|nr:sulfite oxidase-like oxidoreductase [Embleya scabrispora]MYS81124.1 molybdopterin-dependent oxidoreductase [Streptomyces sp. SID5474]